MVYYVYANNLKMTPCEFYTHLLYKKIKRHLLFLFFFFCNI